MRSSFVVLSLYLDCACAACREQIKHSPTRSPTVREDENGDPATNRPTDRADQSRLTTPACFDSASIHEEKTTTVSVNDQQTRA